MLTGNRRRWFWSRWAALLAATGLLITSVSLASSAFAPQRAQAQATPAWTASWTAAIAGSLAGQYAVDATVRQDAPLSIGGTEVRAQISNQFGNAPLVISAATAAVAGAGPAVVAGTVTPLTFSGATSVTVPVGATIYSDAVPLVVHGGQSVAVSLYVSGRDLISEHYDAGNGVSYASLEGAGNLTADVTGAGLAYPQTWDRFVSAVDVAGGATPPRATVVLGDSISDGYNFLCPGQQSFCNLTTAWPTVLTQRLLALPAAQRVGIANEAITANTVLHLSDDYSRVGGGPSGVHRLASDVLAQPGVDRIFLLLGTNDLWFGATATQVINGYRQILAKAKAAGVPVIVSTLLPRSTGKEVWTPAMEANRLAVNHWIRTSGAFAAVIDLAEVAGDVYNGACQPNLMYPPYDSGDNLHPSTAGQIAMANAIPTQLLGAGVAPLAPPLVAATPTPGCLHHPIVTVYSSALSSAAVPTTTTTPPSTTAPTTTTPVPATSPASKQTPGSKTPSASGPTGPVPGGSSGPWIVLAAMALTLLGVAVVILRIAANARRERARRQRLAAQHYRRPVGSDARWPG